jgi:hypothetical protein
MKGHIKMKFWIKLATGLLFLITLISCNALPDEISTDDVPANGKVESSESREPAAAQNWVILSGVSKREVEIASMLFESDDYWKPSEEDISVIEENIADYLRLNSGEFYWEPPVWERLEEYQRQYLGLKRGDKQFIFGNFFCENGSINWKKELMFAIDGGECYFQVEYDVERGVFVKLAVNGES